MTSIRVYVDTCVFGGVFDEEFREESRAFFDEARSGRFRLVVSAIVAGEVRRAPAQVREWFEALTPWLETVRVSDGALRLVDAYVGAGIVTERRRTDALHVAIAVASGCQAIVSWNFRHLVHFDKIALYNEVNLTQGFGTIAIHTPQEVLYYEDEDEDI